jgi:hypothetical protein
LKSSKLERFDKKMAAKYGKTSGRDGCPDKKKWAGTVGGINRKNVCDDCMAMMNGKEGWYLQ